jgi:hypothetical protein
MILHTYSHNLKWGQNMVMQSLWFILLYVELMTHGAIPCSLLVCCSVLRLIYNVTVFEDAIEV